VRPCSACKAAERSARARARRPEEETTIVIDSCRNDPSRTSERVERKKSILFPFLSLYLELGWRRIRSKSAIFCGSSHCAWASVRTDATPNVPYKIVGVKWR